MPGSPTPRAKLTGKENVACGNMQMQLAVQQVGASAKPSFAPAPRRCQSALLNSLVTGDSDSGIEPGGSSIPPCSPASSQNSRSQLALRTSTGSCNSVQSSKSQLQLNAEQKLRTLAKLQKDDEALRRKATHLSTTSQNRRAANNLKAQRVAEHCRRSEEEAEARFRNLQATDCARQTTVGEREASERDRWSCWGEHLEDAICKKASARDAMNQAREDRIRKKLEDDEEKMRRKAQHLQDLTADRQAANAHKSETAAEHRRQFSEAQEERLRRLAASDATRSSCVRHRAEAEGQRLKYLGNHLDSALAEAAKVRQEMQKATEHRISEKLQKDAEKVVRKSQHLENQCQRLQTQSRIREQRVERTKFYENLVENARAANSGTFGVR